MGDLFSYRARLPRSIARAVKQTVDLVRRMEADDAYLCVATLYPGTELRALLENMGWKMLDDWSLYDTINPVVENPLDLLKR